MTSSNSSAARARCAQSILLWLAGSAALGCDFPVSSTKYRVVGDEGGAFGATAGEGGDDAQSTGEPGSDDISPAVQKLIHAFAGDDEECAAAFAKSCAQALAECGAHAGCVDYGVCLRERATPTAETTCSDDRHTSMDDSWKLELVRHCWATRYAECDIGHDFSCVGAYGPPSGERSAVEVRQQIMLRGAENTETDFTIRFCPEWSDCSTPLAEVMTDKLTGFYDVTLPVGGKNSGVGNNWAGFRLVRGTSLPDSIVTTNVPLWGRRVEITRLLDTAQVAGLAFWYGVDATRTVFVQIVDCKSDPAPGISFELPTSTTETVGYVDDAGNRIEGSTVASGAGAISDYDPQELQTIWAVREGTTIATWNGELSAGMPRYLRLHPMGRQ